MKKCYTGADECSIRVFVKVIVVLKQCNMRTAVQISEDPLYIYNFLFHRNVEPLDDLETPENQNYNTFQESLLEFTSNNT